jgi:hypothetical protein
VHLRLSTQHYAPLVPRLPGIFPHYAAPIMRNQPDGRELIMAR